MTPRKTGWYLDMVDLEATIDLHKRGKVTIKFGELIVSSDFDSGTERQGGYCWIQPLLIIYTYREQLIFASGNLDRVEECKSPDADTREFDLWTAPDCAGTEFENCNRTWFYFSVLVPANFGPGKILRWGVDSMEWFQICPCGFCWSILIIKYESLAFLHINILLVRGRESMLWYMPIEPFFL